MSKTADGNAMVTNFRFCVCERRSFINIPVLMVSEVFVIEAAKRLRIGCKDGSTYRSENTLLITLPLLELAIIVGY